MDVAFGAFGFDRTMFGGAWPVALQAIKPVAWVAFLDDVLRDTTESERVRFWRDNAIRTYRLQP